MEQQILKATAGGDADRLLKLLQGSTSAGFDLNQRFEGQKNRTLLHLAAEGGHAVVVGLLLERGADYTIIDNDRCTAMDLAVNNEHAECGYMLAKTLMSAAEWQAKQLEQARAAAGQG